MINVSEVVRTCHACPSQWEGTTNEGKRVYARYRWGFLRVDVDDETIFAEQIGKEATPDQDEQVYESMKASGWQEEAIQSVRSSTEMMRQLAAERGEKLSFDGHLSYQELRKATHGVISWPSQEGY
jgi:hypothetical protein